MAFLYHIIPEDMRGEILYPLNKLKGKFPDIYNKKVKKYSGREDVFDKAVPPLDCKWNDVIHLTAVNPSKIMKALKNVGNEVQKMKWYKIPAETLDVKDSIIYIYKFKKDLSQITASDQFTNYSVSKLSRYDKIPYKTIQYYKEEMGNGKMPLLFHFIPHVFYKGQIDVSECEIIEV